MEDKWIIGYMFKLAIISVNTTITTPIVKILHDMYKPKISSN